MYVLRQCVFFLLLSHSFYFGCINKCNEYDLCVFNFGRFQKIYNSMGNYFNVGFEFYLNLYIISNAYRNIHLSL